ncbi:MAG TPA: MarC family protein [Planctomycetota bacterium]|nr:MarC family protein [Planctomycetota bacterium]
MNEFLKSFLLTFIPLFVATDAIGNIPLFVALTEGLSQRERNRVADVSVLMATIIVLLFMIGGQLVFSLLEISVADFRIAGGILLLVLSTHMLIAGKTTAGAGGDVAIFPLASPLVAGPAVLTTTLVLGSSHGLLMTLLSLVLNMAITWGVFRKCGRIEMLITRQGSKAFSKVVEIILAAIAVSMIRHGLETLFMPG